VGPRAGLDGRKISSQSEFGPGPSSPESGALPTELHDPRNTDKRTRKYDEISIASRSFTKASENCAIRNSRNS